MRTGLFVNILKIQFGKRYDSLCNPAIQARDLERLAFGLQRDFIAGLLRKRGFRAAGLSPRAEGLYSCGLLRKAGGADGDREAHLDGSRRLAGLAGRENPFPLEAFTAMDSSEPHLVQLSLKHFEFCSADLVSVS